MYSDDTEHAVLTLQALYHSGLCEQKFRDDLAWKLRWWLVLMPGGVGWATLRSGIKLWLGGYEGVRSAGNGPAMRSSVLGIMMGNEPTRLQRFVRISTRLTHTDIKAEKGAWVVAVAAHISATAAGRLQTQELAGEFLNAVHPGLDNQEGTELFSLLTKAARHASDSSGETVSFAQSIGLPNYVNGYMYHTVPVSIHAWLKHPNDFKSAVNAVISCGGDTDTTGAITGALVGAGVGKEGLPGDWLLKIFEWPWSQAFLEDLAENAEQPKNGAGIFPMWHGPARLLRNLFFICVVLAHGFRRLFPPY